jgi:hypothetical protein
MAPLVPLVPTIREPTMDLVKPDGGEGAGSLMDDSRVPQNMKTPDPSGQDMIYFLSPLNLSHNITPVSSSTVDAAPLPAANNEIHSIPKDTSVITLPSPVVEPTPIPVPVPREPSGISISRPKAAPVDHGLSRSLPVQGSVLSMHRSPPSPTSKKPASSSTVGLHSAVDGHSNVPSRTGSRASVQTESSEDVEVLRVRQLHDLLDSPLQSSRVANLAHSDSGHQPRSRSYSSSSLRPQSSMLHSASRPPLTPNITSKDVTQPLASTLPTNSSVHSRPSLTRVDSLPSQRKVMSSASTAAQAIEREQKERRRAEREKEQEQQARLNKELERERELQAQRDRDLQQRSRLAVVASSASLREANATYGPGSTQPHRFGLAPTNGKGRILGYA